MLKIFKYRVILVYLSIIICLFIIFLITSLIIFKNQNKKIHIKRLEQISLGIEKILSKEKIENNLLKNLSIATQSRITIINKDGNVIFDSEKDNLENIENHSNRPEMITARKKGIGISIRFSKTTNQEMIYFAKELTELQNSLIIRVALPYNKLIEEFKIIKRAFIVYLSIVFILTVLIIFKITNKLTKPIEEIIFASKQFAKGDFDYKIQDNKFYGEMKKLAQTLNAMAEKIKQNMETLEKQIKAATEIAENLDEAICIYTNKEILYANSSFCKLFEIHTIRNYMISEVVRNTEIINLLTESLNKKAIVAKEIIISNKYYYLKTYPFKNSHDTTIQVAVFYDIDIIKKLDTIKKDFIANFSHEIKTPLTVIKTNIETMTLHNLSPQEINFFLNSTQKNIERIENILKDIISLNYVESNINLSIEKINILELVQDIISIFHNKIKEMEIKIEINIDKSIEIKTDRELFEKILINLIDNAIKYNQKNGFIIIKAKYINEKIEMIFENSGKPIPHEYLDRIFERFFTVDKSRSRSVGGTGLGLSIVKHATEKLGGTIKANSTSHSNIFILSLPI